jgi:outer membrane protein TolC
MPVYAVATPESPTTGIYPIETQDIDINANNDITAGISLRQKLFDMNVFRGLEASSQYTDLTATTYDAVRQGTVTRAKRLFYQTLLLKEVLEVREISEEIAYENYLDAKRRLDNGVASPLEALQAEVSWKLTEPNTSQARRNLNVAMENLRNLAGLPEDREIVLEGSLERLPELPEFLPAEDIRGRRPDYRLLLNEEALRKINISVERSKFYPSISASVNYGLQTGDDGFDFDLDDATDTLTAGITVSVPIFYGGSRFASLEKARLELQRTRSQMAQKESDISTELENIQLTLEEAKLRVDTARQTLETAEKAYEVSRTSVENGLATQLELKDARVSLEQARLGYLTAGFDYLSAYFDWQMATGRGAEVPSAAGR